MDKKEELTNEFVMNFGYAYKTFGLSKLMGHVVALLMTSPAPVALEDIAKKLGRSKGPISQLTRRLRDKNLIRRVWQPTSRKDFYEIQPEIFENAFRNRLDMIRNNTKLANQYKARISKEKIKDLELLDTRLSEMEKFYELMDKHYRKFLDEWEIERNKINK